LKDNTAIDRNSWADIQREFLAAYAPRFTAQTTCTNFQDLIQQNGENVHDYYLRVSDAFKKGARPSQPRSPPSESTEEQLQQHKPRPSNLKASRTLKDFSSTNYLSLDSKKTSG
jgi:hypothetical protein